jgi:hypothetical protein
VRGTLKSAMESEIIPTHDGRTAPAHPGAPAAAPVSPTARGTAPAQARRTTKRAKAPARWAMAGLTALAFGGFWVAVSPGAAAVTAAPVATAAPATATTGAAGAAASTGASSSTTRLRTRGS